MAQVADTLLALCMPSRIAKAHAGTAQALGTASATQGVSVHGRGASQSFSRAQQEQPAKRMRALPYQGPVAFTVLSSGTGALRPCHGGLRGVAPDVQTSALPWRHNQSLQGTCRLRRQAPELQR
jgi:hypothetical protein